jgi:hypothetical protein
MIDRDCLGERVLTEHRVVPVLTEHQQAWLQQQQSNSLLHRCRIETGAGTASGFDLVRA